MSRRNLILPTPNRRAGDLTEAGDAFIGMNFDH
jgi:hypothetical protein